MPTFSAVYYISGLRWRQVTDIMFYICRYPKAVRQTRVNEGKRGRMFVRWVGYLHRTFRFGPASNKTKIVRSPDLDGRQPAACSPQPASRQDKDARGLCQSLPREARFLMQAL